MLIQIPFPSFGHWGIEICQVGSRVKRKEERSGCCIPTNDQKARVKVRERRQAKVEGRSPERLHRSEDRARREKSRSREMTMSIHDTTYTWGKKKQYQSTNAELMVQLVNNPKKNTKGKKDDNGP